MRLAHLIVVLDGFELAVIQHHLGGAPFIDDAHRDLVIHRLGHGVAVDGVAEHIQGGVDGGAGKAHIGGMGQRVVQVLGEAVALFDRALLLVDREFQIEVDLAAVGLIGDTDDVAALGEQLNIFGELVNGGEEDAATGAPGQFVAQILTAGHRLNHRIADKGGGAAELLGQLFIQIGAVCDEDEGRAGKVDALHQQPRQKLHGVALAATGGAKVGAAFTAPAAVFHHHEPGTVRAAHQLFALFLDVVVELAGGVILGVAAADLAFAVAGIGEEDEVFQHIQQS